MRVFVAVIAILLLPYCSSEEKSCGENVEKVREFYRDSDSSFGYIQTPKFPRPFATPITQRWIINASAWQSPFQINVYLTQLYVTDYRYLQFYQSKTDPCSLPNIQEAREPAHEPNAVVGDWKSARLITTHLPYMEIELKLDTLYNSHLRTDYFLESYGLNITYEIVPGNRSRDDSCTLKRCHYAGNCYVDRYYKRFFCDCHKDHSGEHCEYGPRCNQKINSCQNGGKCSSLGGAAMRCNCSNTGYIGLKCEKEGSPLTKECPGEFCKPVCSSLNDTSKLRRPCSCHNGSEIPNGFVKFEGKLKLVSPSLQIWNRRNSSSVPYTITEIEKELTRILKAATGPKNMDEVSVMSIGPGSEFSFQFAGRISIHNQSFNALNQLKSKGELKGGYKLGTTLFTLRVQPALNMTDLLQSHQKNIRVGRQFSLTCVAVGSSEIQFSWYKDGAPIDKSIATRHIDVDDNPRNGADESRSVLSIAKAAPFDSGIFTCKVSDMGKDSCRDINIDIVLPPQIDILPMSLTLIRNSSAIVNCIDNQYGKSIELTAKKNIFEWEKNDQKIIKVGDEVAEELYPQGKFLRIIRAVESAKFTCGASNLAGESKREIQVEVLDSRNSPSCRNQKESIGDAKLEWKWSAPKQVAMEQCPTNYFGYVQRRCLLIGSKAQWGLSDFSKCLCSRLQKINTTLQNLKMGFAVLSDVDEIWELMENYISNKTFLYPGEGEKIISVLIDISEYILARGTTNKAFPSLYKIVDKFLRFPKSCVQEKSIMLLNRLMEKMILNYTYISTENTHLFVSDDLVIESMKMVVPIQLTFPYFFPRKSAVYPKWLQLRAEVPVDNSTTLIFIVFRNFTKSLSPYPEKFKTKEKISISLVSSVVKLTVPPTPTVYFHQTSKIPLYFDVSRNYIIQAESSKLNLTCGALQQIEHGIEWITDACPLKAVVNNTVHCECDRFGQYAVLLVSSPNDNEENPELPLNWCVITGCITCIVGCALALIVMWFHIQFRIETNSLYTLKTFVCLSLIMSILIILSLRNSESSIWLSTCLCATLIISLCCQLTKALNIMFSTQMELFPWLKTVSLVTLFGAVSFGSILPVLTAAAILSHSRSVEKNTIELSVLNETSPVFGTFITVVSLIVLAFLVVYYKTVLTVRSIRVKVDPSKVHILDYRTKTLNRALLITLSILLTILATILYGNIKNVEFYQYFFGLTAFTTGLIVFFSYTIKSEYPIPLSLTKSLESGQPDPERPIRRESDRENASRAGGKSLENGPVSSILLQGQSLEPQLYSDAETTLDTLVGSSIATTSRQSSVKRPSSVSSMKRPSISSSNKIPRSMTNPPNFGSSSTCVVDCPHYRSRRPCSAFCKKNKSMKFHSSSTGSSGSVLSDMKLNRVECLLRSDYVLPSNSGNTSAVADAKTSSTCPSSSKEMFATDYVDPQPQYPAAVVMEVPELRTFQPQQCKVDIERCDKQKNIGFDHSSRNREERIIEGGADPSMSGYEEHIPTSSYFANDCELTDKTDSNRKPITELQFMNISGEIKNPPNSNKSDPDLLVKKITQDLDIIFNRANPQTY